MPTREHSKIIDTQAAKTLVIDAIRGLSFGWEVVIREPRKSRDQEKKFRAMLRDYAQQVPMSTGAKWDTEDLKAAVMSQAGIAPRTFPSLDGQNIIVAYQSRHNTKSQMGDCIEVLYAAGAEHNVEWRDDIKENEREAAA